MAGFGNFKALGDAYDIGAVKYSTWRKIPTQVTAAGSWFDLSMSPGNPVPNYYASAPLVAAAMSQSNNGGIFHGGAVSPMQKHLAKLTAMTVVAGAVPLPMMLCDYVLYYPFVDEGTTDYQPMDNTVTLPRHVSGVGVQIMAVVVGAQAGGAEFQVTYTNSDGVAGRVTPFVRCTAQAVNGTIISTQSALLNSAGPFLPLQNGDTGVRQIDGFQMSAEDVGLVTLVLIKPIASVSMREITAPAEVDYAINFPSLPKVADDAYLNFICYPAGSLLSANILGDATFVWN